MKKFTATILLAGYSLKQAKHALKLDLETHCCDDTLLSLVPFGETSYAATIQFEGCSASSIKDIERHFKQAFGLEEFDDKLLSLAENAFAAVSNAPLERVLH